MRRILFHLLVLFLACTSLRATTISCQFTNRGSDNCYIRGGDVDLGANENTGWLSANPHTQVNAGPNSQTGHHWAIWVYDHTGTNLIGGSSFIEGTGNPVNVWVYSFNSAEPWTFDMTRCVKNTTSQWGTAYWKRNGVVEYYEVIAPNSIACHTYLAATAADSLEYGVFGTEINPYVGGDGNVVVTNTPVPHNPTTESNPGGGSGPGSGTNYSSGGGDPWRDLQTNGPIDWTGYGTTTYDALKSGFNALLSESEKHTALLSLLHSDNLVMTGEMSNVLLTALSGGTGTTSSVTVNVTNINNITNAITNSLNLGTNLVDGSETGHSWLRGRLLSLAGFLYGGVTNAWSEAACRAQADSAGGGVFRTAIDAFKSSVTGPPIADNLSGSPDVEIPVGNYTMTVGIFHGAWGSVWDFARRFAEWILVAAFLMKVSKDMMEAVSATYQAQQLRFPNLTAGIEIFAEGGTFNWGALAAPTLLVLIAVFTLAVTTFLTGALLGWGGFVTTFNTDFSSGLSGSAASGFAALQRAFPLHTAITLSVSYILWRLEMSAVCFLYGALMRALPG